MGRAEQAALSIPRKDGARAGYQPAHSRVLREGRSPDPACRRVGDPNADIINLI
jgi:hypothetical protein